MTSHHEHAHRQRLPYFNGFRPLGVQNSKKISDVVISYQEYEVLILCDSECRSEKDAARIMQVSHRYLHSIHKTVMKKIAKAFTEGREIYFGESDINVANWYECKFCGISFTLTSGSGAMCPFCKTSLLKLN